MNVVLIGFRCAGKSSVGKALADVLAREFVDCDEYIERRTQLSIREIFEKWGESHFRSLESEAIAEIAKLDGKIIATGGGAVLKHKNIQVLKRNGTIFYLEVTPEVSLERMQQDASTRERRPSLTDKDPLSEIREQIEFRQPYYREGGDFTILTDGKKVEDVVKEIMARLKRRGHEERQDMDEAPA